MNPTVLEIAAAEGVTANALKKWRKRGKVPGKYHLQLVEAAQKKGLQLSSRDFGTAATSKPRKRGRAA
jgi:transposase-like protein